MPGKHSAQHVSQHSAPRHSSRPARTGWDDEDKENYAPQRRYETAPYSNERGNEGEEPRQSYEARQDREYGSNRGADRHPAPVRLEKSGGSRIASLVLRDVLITGLILCVFALFHHVIPRMSAKGQTAEPVSVIQTPAPAVTSAVTAEPLQEEEPQPEETAEPETEATPEPDNRTEWQIKFEDKFTDEVVVTDTSYTSPDVAIYLEQRTFTDDYGPTVYYVADIYVSSLESFKTYFANGVYTYYGYEAPLSAAKNSGAILSVNGDYADNQTEGFLVRNGELYYQEKSVFDICVLYYDGVMETYTPDDYEVEDILARSPVQSWKFGPALLDSAGNAKTEFNDTSSGIEDTNPRSAIGYYEPGHYCLLVADGRQSFSRGLTLIQLSSVFESMGCRAAYNLDGGASAVMVFNGKVINSPSNGGRDCGDIVLVCEPEKKEEGAEG